MLSKKQKSYLKLNIVSILFAAVSLLSVTLAWFAYSGLASVGTEVGVSAWYIEFEKNNKVATNDIVISLASIYPGMETLKEEINIKNLGDSDAKIKVNIFINLCPAQRGTYYIWWNSDGNRRSRKGFT